MSGTSNYTIRVDMRTKSHVPHDAVYKQFFHDPKMVESLLRGYIPQYFIEQLDFATLVRLQDSYVTRDFRLRFSDIVWRIQWKNGQCCYIIVLLEFQSTIDYWMALRLGAYTNLLLLDLVATGQFKVGEKLPPVLPIVLYNGEPRWNAPTESLELFVDLPEDIMRGISKQGFFLLDVGRLLAEGLNMESGKLASLLFRLDKPESAAQLLQAVAELLVVLPRNEGNLFLRQAFLSFLKGYILPKFGTTKELDKINELEDISPMLEERIEQWKRDYINQGLEQGMAKVREAREEAREAREELRKVRDGIVHHLIDALQRRFGTVPPSLGAYLATVSDEDVLLRLYERALLTDSLQNFIKQLPVQDARS